VLAEKTKETLVLAEKTPETLVLAEKTPETSRHVLFLTIDKSANEHQTPTCRH